MNTATAMRLIGDHVTAMGVAHAKMVFDEIFILTGAYTSGPSKIYPIDLLRGVDELAERFERDVIHLREELQNSEKEPIGYRYFEFDARKTLYDAFMKIGDDAVVIFNNTSLSMEEIILNEGADWVKIEEILLSLSRTLVNDPLVAEEG